MLYAIPLPVYLNCLKHKKSMISRHKNLLFCCLCAILFTVSCKTVATISHSKIEVPATSYQSKVWVADQGNGTYKNPIIHADYSDPDVIRVGNDYFMTASSFQCMPGLPILHSKDLVNWSIVN
jgi:hypothetical protein